MSIDSVIEYFKVYKKEKDIIQSKHSSATVELAALALGVEPARIAKTISFRFNDSAILVVAAGDTKIDNKKFKSYFGVKAKMLSAEEVLNFIGHPIGGVCPFAVKNTTVRVFCDISLKRFTTVFPACGSPNSAIELTCDELEKYSNCTEWVDVCKIIDIVNLNKI